MYASPNKNWSSLINPDKITVKPCDESDSSASKVIIEPLERGFGSTLGLVLRRVLLSSLQGVAVVGIHIEGVKHEYDTIDGVKEDISDLILNIKGIDFSFNEYGFVKLKLPVNAQGDVYAGMIEQDDNISVINPTHKICTVTSSSAEFVIEIFCATGKGYVEDALFQQDTKDYRIPQNAISLDAYFSPIKSVGYSVENKRVGQKTDYDKLILSIETNGSITAEWAIGLAARILQDQLQGLINFQDDVESDLTADSEAATDLNPKLFKRIADLELSVRSQNCLKGGNLVYLGDLAKQTESQMLNTPNFGKKSLDELKKILSDFGLSFGMKIEQWPPSNIDELSKKYSDIT